MGVTGGRGDRGCCEILLHRLSEFTKVWKNVQNFTGEVEGGRGISKCSTEWVGKFPK